MKYLGYLILLAGVLAGYLGLRVWLVFVLAFLSTFAFASARRNVLQNTPQAPDKNMVLDGMFLFFSQILVLFAVYLLGVFIASPGGDLFADFLTGKRVGPDAGMTE